MFYIGTRSNVANLSPLVTHSISPPQQQHHPQPTKIMHGQQDSPLLRLPAELCNEIYGHVLTEARPIEVHRAFAPTSKDPDCRLRFSLSTTIPSRHFAVLLPLAQVCRQIRAETIALPYTLNIFALEVEFINEFVAALPAHFRTIITRLAIRTSRHQHPHLLELRFHPSHGILEGLARLPALSKIFLPNYRTPALHEEKWRAAILSNAGLKVEVEKVIEMIVTVTTRKGMELALAERYW
jgi:hypothetical protein